MATNRLRKFLRVALAATTIAMHAAVAGAAGPVFFSPASSPKQAGAGHYAVDFDAAPLLRMSPGETATVNLPDEMTVEAVFERTVAHANGDVSWIGHSARFGPAFRVIFTTGRHGSFGTISQPGSWWGFHPGEGGKGHWLVDQRLAGERLTLEHDSPEAPPLDAAQERIEAMQRARPPEAKAMPVPQATIDWLVLYSQGMAAMLGPGIGTYLNQLVAGVNQAYVDSEVAITLRLVGAFPVAPPETGDNAYMLNEVRGSTPWSADVPAMRDAVGADLVSLFRPSHATHVSAGIAFIGGGGGGGETIVNSSGSGFSVMSATGTPNSFLVAHELGHNMGAKHDRIRNALEGNGIGAYDYCFGYRDVGRYGTVMAYTQFPETGLTRFSNPNHLCQGTVCGVPATQTGASADNALCLNQTRGSVKNGAYVPGVQDYRPAASGAGVARFASDAYRAPSSAGQVVLRLYRVGGISGALTVNYATAPGTASAGSDYTAVSGAVTWAHGDYLPKTIVVPIAPNTAGENDETFTVALSGAVGSPASATVTIDAERGELEFRLTPHRILESGAPVPVRVARTGGARGAVSVSYNTYTSTGAGWASANADYTPASGTLSWADGDASERTILVTPVADAVEDDEEKLWVQLSNPAGGARLGAQYFSYVFLREAAGAFPPGAAPPPGWNKPPGAARTWVVARDTASEGAYSLRSDDLAPGQWAGIQFACNVTSAGNLTLSYQAVGDDGDTFSILVDGSQALAWRVNGAYRNVAFLGFSKAITPGSHTFVFRFDRASPGQGFAAAWIDGVGLPPGCVPAPILDPLADEDGDGMPNEVEFREGRNPYAKDNDVLGSARLFAMQQFRDFMGREGDAGSVQVWTDLINGGVTRGQAVEGFAGAAEYAGIVGPVTRLYFATFLRVPDYAGMTFNASLVRQGTITLTQLADFFTASPEFLSTYGSLDNAQFVTLLYANVLGRAPDPGGLAGWVALLGGGYSRGQVLMGFSESVEYQARMANEVFVTSLYSALLRRAPDPGGFNGWLAYLDGGGSRAATAGAFVGSGEYRARFLP